MTELTAVGIDYTKVTPLQQKRVHSFLGQYVSETVSYLNRLSTACEQQLEASSQELRRLDATLSVLESKLASLPDLPNAAAPPANQSAPAAAASQSGAATAEMTPASASAAAVAAAAAPAAASEEAAAASGGGVEQPNGPPRIRAADHPLYAGFFKMLKVGVPIPAIKLKMQASGVDPSVLDLDPDAPIDDAAAGAGKSATEAAAAAAASSDSGSDFTDSD